MTLFANQIENREAERLLIATGEVEVRQAESRLQADRLEVNLDTGEAVALGNVIFFDGQDRIRGERLEYNFKTETGVIFRGDAFAEPHFFVRGERMERIGEKTYRVQQGIFTTCERPTPDWSIHAGQMTATLDDYAWGTNASFWVWKVPLIPFIPYIAVPIRQDRQSGFLMPRLGSSNTKGFFFKQPLYLVLDDNQDLTLRADVFSKMGVGLGADYRYIRNQSSRGDWEGYLAYDKERQGLRGTLSLRHDESFPAPLFGGTLTGKADINTVTDDTFFQVYGDSLFDKSRTRVESNLTVTQRWNQWNLVGNFLYYQDLTVDKAIELQRLPQVRLTGVRQPVPFASALQFDLEGSYVNFFREEGSDGQRLDLHPKLYLPLSVGGLFTVVPFAGARETLYSTRVTGTTLIDARFRQADGSFFDGTLAVDTFREQFQSRFLPEAGADVETRLSRVFAAGDFFGIDKIQHVIEPRVGYRYLPDLPRGGLPQFDEIDALGQTNLITYSLTNRVNAKAPAEGETPPRRWELARLTLSQSYDLRQPRDEMTAERPKRPFSDVYGDLRVNPFPELTSRTDASFNVYTHSLTSFNTDVSYGRGDLRGLLGYRYSRFPRFQSTEFFTGSARAKLSQQWEVAASTNWDTKSGTFVENRVEATFFEQCWAASLALTANVSETIFAVTVNLLELGSFGSSRSGGR